jgi:hypothetical protein
MVLGAHRHRARFLDPTHRAREPLLGTALLLRRMRDRKSDVAG